MDDRRYHNGGYRPYDDHHREGSRPLTEEGAEHDYHRKQEAGREILNDALTIKTDEKTGKKYILGFIPIPPSMEIGFNQLITTIRPYITEFGMSSAYDGTSGVMKFFKTGSKDLQHRSGLIAAKVAGGALLLAQPVATLAGAYQQYRDEKGEVLQNFALAVEGDNGKYKNNEILKTKLEKIADRIKTSAWSVASDLPTLGVTGGFALKDYKAMRAEKTHEHFGHQQVPSEPVTRDQLSELLNSRGDKSNSKDMLKPIAVFGAGLGSEYLKWGLNTSADKRIESLDAGDMILYLKQVVDQQCGRDGDCDQSFRTHDPDDIRIPVMEGMTVNDRDMRSGGVSLETFIEAIIQQNERDRKRHVLGGVFKPELHKSIRLVAEVIADGRLDTMALTNLIGNGKIVIHPAKGPIKIATEAQTQEALNKLLPSMGMREAIQKDAFFGNFRDPQGTQNIVKDNLEKFQGNQKALFASLFPDDILEESGLRKKKIRELREEAYKGGRIYDFMAANILHLDKKGEEALQKLGLSPEDTQAISRIAEEMKAGDLRIIERAVDGNDKSAIKAVRAAGLALQLGEEKDYWADRTKEMTGIREKLKADEKRNEEKAIESAEVEKSTPLSAVERSKKLTTDTPETSFVARENQRKSQDPTTEVGMTP